MARTFLIHKRYSVNMGDRRGKGRRKPRRKGENVVYDICSYISVIPNGLFTSNSQTAIFITQYLLISE